MPLFLMINIANWKLIVTIVKYWFLLLSFSLCKLMSLFQDWLDGSAAVTICSDFGAQENKSVIVSTVSPSICHEVMGLDAMILVSWMSSNPTFSLSFYTFIKRLFSSSSLSAIMDVCHLHIWGYWYFPQQSWLQLELHPAQHFNWCTLHRS